jgi:hypothetical protein
MSPPLQLLDNTAPMALELGIVLCASDSETEIRENGVGMLAAMGV